MNPINLKFIAKILGQLLLLLSIAMVIGLLWALGEKYTAANFNITHNHVINAFVSTIAIGLFLGLMLKYVGRKSEAYLGRREALLLVSLTWFIGAGISALPFWLWALQHDFPFGADPAFKSFVNCYFEAMSGLTTTGSTILTQVESIPNGLLLWRAFTHWLGGLGIVVIFVALLPGIAGGTKQLYHVEASGLGGGNQASIRETARWLVIIYLLFTFLEIVFLKFADPQMTWFDNLVHTFGTLSSGGFSSYNASVGALSPAVQWVVSLFMLIAGVNFGLYHLLFKGQFSSVFKNSELLLYLAITITAFFCILITIWDIPYQTTLGSQSSLNPADRVRDAIFQTLSIQTGTGFATVNFDQWGNSTKAILVFLMLIGGCGGSTCGGIKVIRLLSIGKIIGQELEKSYRPHVLRPIRIGGHILNDSQRIAVLSYITVIFILTGLVSMLLLLIEQDLDATTALTASLASICNVGPGLAGVGAVENYGWFSAGSKTLLCILMALGRLEVFAVAVIFLPKFWRGK
ncbi:MAG: TrkH family potassium uptake protein [Oligoflexales bacterium]